MPLSGVLRCSGKVMKMKQFARDIPLVLQRQILLRVAVAALALWFGTVVLVLHSPVVATPFLLAALLSAGSAGHIYHMAIKQHVLELRGVVLSLERTMFRRRVKAMLLEVEGKALRVVLHSSQKLPMRGDQITLFIQDATPLYEWRGLHQLGGYLALVVERTSVRS